MAGTAYFRRAVSRWDVLAPLAVLGVGVWIISSRFSISGPSLIDDWDALLSAPASMHAIVRLNYQDPQRFFPSWILWNWMQWRLPGAPGNMLGPNLAGVGRLALLIAGLTALSHAVVSWRGQHRIERSALCSLPALVIVTVPEFAQDLARFGPEEPALVGGLMLGGTLMFWGGRELAAGSMRSAPAWLLVAVGFVLWCYGAGQKETSVCLLLLFGLAVPFRAVLGRLDRRQRTILVSLVSLATLPLLVVLYEVIRIVQRGTLVYDAHVKGGTGALSAFTHALRVQYSSTHSFAGLVLIALALGGVLRSLRPLSVDWIQIAVVVLAAASLEMSVQTNVYESRYYLPTLALLAVGSARTIARIPAPARFGVIAAGAVLALVSALPAHSTVRTWAAGDQRGDDLVQAVRTHTNRGCHLTISGVDDERSKSIAALVAYPDGHRSCAAVARYALVGPTSDPSFDPACTPRKGAVLGEWNVSNLEQIQLIRCTTG